MRQQHSLAPESAVALEVDGRRMSVFLCTPLSLDELAVGHLVGKGLLPERGALASVFVCPDRGSVSITRVGCPPLPEAGVALLLSACGAGGDPGGLLGLEDRGPLPPSAPLGLAWLEERSRDMFAAAELYRETGGMHCAALAEAGSGRFVAREDVGRHNAVDKVLGRGFLDGYDFPRCVLLSSGRIAADMAAKAAFAGVPILASRSVPTTAAYAIAQRFGIALVGRLGSREPLLYCGAERLAGFLPPGR